jgi:hypothetical protein
MLFKKQKELSYSDVKSMAHLSAHSIIDEKIKESDQKTERVNDDVKVLLGITSFLLNDSNYRLYIVKDINGDSIFPFPSLTFSRRYWNKQDYCLDIREITTQELQTLGSYSSFVIGDKTYVIAKAKKEKKGKKK